jgi:hypothetical protein
LIDALHHHNNSTRVAGTGTGLIGEEEEHAPPSANVVNKRPSGRGELYHVSEVVLGKEPKMPEKDTSINSLLRANGQSLGATFGQIQEEFQEPLGTQGGRSAWTESVKYNNDRIKKRI